MGKIPALGENSPSLKTVLGTAEHLHPSGPTPENVCGTQS